MQASVWLSWCFDQRTQPVCGVWRPSTPCVRWSNPGFVLIHSAPPLTFAPLPFASFLHPFSHHLLSDFTPSSISLQRLEIEPTFKCPAEVKNNNLCALPHLKWIIWVFFANCFKTGHVFKKYFPCLLQIRSQAQFQDLCQQHVRGEAEGTSRSGCCPSWSLGNYLAVLTNASCCLSLTSHQVQQIKKKKKKHLSHYL